MKKILRYAFLAFALLYLPNTNFAQAPVLGSAAGFVLFTSVGAIGNTGISQLTGNVGTDNGAITGFGNVNGVMHNHDGATFQCAADLLLAYQQLNNAIPGFFHAPLLGNGDTLLAGVYSVTGNATLNLNLYLDAKGDTNAVFIFQISGTLSTGSASQVVLLNGAKACNVFWKTEGMVSLATGTIMRGTIVANNAAITISSGVTLEGRALSTTGAVNVSALLGFTPVGCASPILTGPLTPPLGSATCFALLSGDGDITNTGITHIAGDIGTHVGAVGGFNALFVNGTIHPSPDGATAQASADLIVLYNYLNNLPCDIELLYPAQFGNSLVLTPHVYCMNAAAQLTDTVFLNAEGNPNAVFVIQINGALTTSTYSNVVLMNGAKSSNVFWKVEGAVTIAGHSVFRGTLVSDNGAINLYTGDTIDGRMLTTNGAITPNAVNLVIPSQHASIAGPDTIALCQGDSVILSATGGVSFLWSTGDTTQSIIVDTAGNFYVITTNTCGGTDTSAITTVILNPVPVPNAGPDKYINNGDSTIIGTPGLPGNTYTWTPRTGLSSDTAAQPEASPADTTMYILTVTSAAGCKKADTVIVYVNTVNAPIAKNDTAYICENGGLVTINILANDSNPGGGPLIAGIDSTTRHGLSLLIANTLTYTPAIGFAGIDTLVYFICNTGLPALCDTASLFIHVDTSFITNLSASVCNGDSLLIAGAYRKIAALYTDTLHTISGCDSIIATVLTVNPVDTTIRSSSVCSGDSVFIAGAYRKLAGTYLDTLTAAGGCDSIVHTILTLNPVYTINQSLSICNGDSLFIGGAYRKVAGTYSQTMSTIYGCDSTVITTLTVNPVPAAIVTASGPTTFCQGDSVILTANAAATYLWSNAANTQSITVFASGNYSVTVTNGNGCSATSTANTVTVIPSPDATITANGPTNFCQGNSVRLTVPAASSYLWSTTETTQSITVSTTGTYAITVSNGSACNGYGSVQVTSSAPPIVNLGPAQNLCSCDTSISLSANVPGNYLWSTTATTQSISVTASGTYFVIVTANNCVVTDTVEINIRCLTVTATVTDPASGSVLSGGDATLSASPGYTSGFYYSWTPSTYLDDSAVQNPHVTSPKSTTTYYVTVKDSTYGCTASASVVLTVVTKGRPVMPNAFTPNGDGLNDLFGPVIPASMKGIYSLVEMRIYDRWGVMVYNGSGYWDGTFNGSAQPPETYVYYVIMHGPDPNNPAVDTDYKMTGSMTLLQ